MFVRHCAIQIILLLAICLSASARSLTMTEEEYSIFEKLLVIERQVEISDSDIEMIERGLEASNPTLRVYAIRCILLQRLDSLWEERKEQIKEQDSVIDFEKLYIFQLTERVFKKPNFRSCPVLDMLPSHLEKLLEKKASPPRQPAPLSTRLLFGGSGYFLLDLVVVDACMRDETPNNSKAREWLKDYQLAIEHEELLDQL